MFTGILWNEMLFFQRIGAHVVFRYSPLAQGTVFRLEKASLDLVCSRNTENKANAVRWIEARTKIGGQAARPDNFC